MASVPGALFLLLSSMAVSNSVVVKGSSSSGFSGPPYSSGSGNCPRSVFDEPLADPAVGVEYLGEVSVRGRPTI